MTFSPYSAPHGRPGPLSPASIRLSILTGFLGAGKTTLLNQLLVDPAVADTVVLINELGEIGLDHLLVEKVDNSVLVLASGCLCCAVRGDLISTLEDLLRRHDDHSLMPFRRLLIETTGLADPAPVMHTVMFHPHLMKRYQLDGVITVVDAVNGEATLDAYEEAVKQVAVADRLVLTKTDLVEADSALRGRLARLNPAAAVLDAAKGQACAATLLNAGVFDPNGKAPQVRDWLNAEAIDNDQHGHARGDHRHAGADMDRSRQDIHRHDARVRAFCLRSPIAIAPMAFDLFVGQLRGAHGPNLLRVKGIVALTDDPDRPVIVHAVQHAFHPPVRLAAWPDADHTTRVVFVGRDLTANSIERLWAAFTGTPSVDAPDAAALGSSPLKLSRGGLLG